VRISLRKPALQTFSLGRYSCYRNRVRKALL
jgi:hypothetical protein